MDDEDIRIAEAKRLARKAIMWSNWSAVLAGLSLVLAVITIITKA